MALTIARAARESFAAYVAHELRTPLATQRCLLELALADTNADVAAWREVGEDVLHACRQQERLIEACLILARSRGGLQGRELQGRESVDLAAIAADALRADELGDLERGLVLEPAKTTGVRDLIERLVANLVSNAVRHNVAGGRIELATRTESGRAVLTVANTGPKVPAGELRRLFQPFHRLDANPTNPSGGLGLGLAIVQAIADAHDATLTAQAPRRGGLAIAVAFTALD